MEKGLFIALEGGEGSGKTTLINIMKKLFEERGHEVVTIREPGGTAYAEQIRELFLNTEGLTGESAAHLMNSARVDNIQKIIQPALDEGKVVISDRFSGSSLVYQGLRKDEYEAVERITKHIPMITIFVDTPPEVGISRIVDNNRETNRLDLLPMDVHESIYAGYEKLPTLKPDIYWDIILDGTLTPNELERVLSNEYIPLMADQLESGKCTSEIKQSVRGQESFIFA